MSMFANRLILFITLLALACAPLRMSMAGPAADAPQPANSHCADMMQHTDTGHDMDMHAGDDAPCQKGCDGSCCDDNCSGCLHAAAAIALTLATLTITHDPARDASPPASYPEGRHSPPFRPPVSL